MRRLSPLDRHRQHRRAGVTSTFESQPSGGTQVSSLPFGTSTPSATTRGENSRLGRFQGGSWRRSPPTLPAMCTRTHLDGKCDVRIGAEASTPVTGAVVEAAACKDSHGVGRAGQGHAPGAPSILPGMALGLQAGQANRPPQGRSPPLGPWVGGQLCCHGTRAAGPRPQAQPCGTHLR